MNAAVPRDKAASFGASRFCPEMNLMIACLRSDCDASFAGLAEAAGEEVDWAAFIDLCANHRVYPTVYEVLRGAGGLVPEGVLSALRDFALHNAIRSMALCGELIRLAGILQQNGIRMLALKGPAMALQIYGYVSRRASCDLDLLVEPGHWPRAGRILAAVGYEKLDMGLTPKQDRAYHAHMFSCGYYRKEPAVEIDLHWALSARQYGRFTFDELWDESELVEIDGHPIRVMARNMVFLHLAMHGAKHCWGELRYLLDVVKAKACLTGSDWGRITSKVDRWHLQRIVGQTMLVSANLLSCSWPEAPGKWADGKIVRGLARTAFAISGMDRAMRRRDIADARQRWKLSFYKSGYEWLLSPRWSDRLFLLRFYLQPCLDDFHALPLPDWLFSLYYPLRPLIFVLRKSGALHDKTR